MGRLGSINELFRKLKTYTTLLNLSVVEKVSICPLCLSKRHLRELWDLSTIDWPVGECGIPVLWVVPHWLKKFCILCEA